MDKMWERQCAWNRLAGIGGRCAALRKAIRGEAEPLCREVRTLADGTLVCHVGGAGAPLMVWAHMESAGFYVAGADEQGFAWAAAEGVNRIDFENASLRAPDGQRAVLRADEVYGDQTTDQTGFYFDFGENENGMPPVGTPLMFDEKPVQLANGRAMAPFGSSHVPCAVLLGLMERMRDSDRNLYFVFADGTAGAAQAARLIEPKCALAVLAAEADDACAETADRQILRLGAGAVLKLRDRYAPCIDQALRDALEHAALRVGAPLQIDASREGDAGCRDIQFQGCGIRTAVLAVPMRGIATPACIWDEGDVKALTDVAAAFCAEREAC